MLEVSWTGLAAGYDDVVIAEQQWQTVLHTP
jgi:hypothetical protein